MATFEYTEEMFVRALSIVTRRRTIMIAILLIFTAIFVEIVVFVTTGSVFWIAFLLFFLFFVFRQWIGRRKWKTIFRETKAFHKTHVFTPARDSYTFQTATGTTNEPWSDVWKIQLEREFLFLWVNSSQCRIIPIEALSKEEFEIVKHVANSVYTRT